MSEREVKTRQTALAAYQDLQVLVPFTVFEFGWDAALASVILPEGNWADELSKLVPWERVRSTNVIICAYDQTGTQVAVFGKVNRPLPKIVELTDEEKLTELVNVIFQKLSQGKYATHDTILADTWATIARAQVHGKTLDQLCAEYGVATTKELS